VCAFIDAEHSMDPLYARAIGVDIDELLVSQPDYGEQALEIADVLVRSGAVDVVAIDSVAALTPRKELEGQMEDVTVGLQARMMSLAMRKLAGNLNRTQTLCLLTNQIREKVGVVYGSPETQPGGRALKFHASQRLDIRRIQTLKNGDGEAVGNRVRVKVVKNKVAAPFRQAEFDIEFGKGISTAACLLDLGCRYDVLGKSGSHYSYGQHRLGRGREEAKAFLAQNPTIAAEVEAEIFTATGIAAERTGPIERDRDETGDRDEITDRDDTKSLPVAGEPLAIAA
jgi:recombination protein RecA